MKDSITQKDFEKQVMEEFDKMKSKDFLYDKKERNGWLLSPLDEKDIKSFILSKLFEAYKKGEKTPHSTEQGYCCACDYDIAVMERKIKEAQREVVEAILDWIDDELKENTQIWMAKVKQSLKEKFNL